MKISPRRELIKSKTSKEHLKAKIKELRATIKRMFGDSRSMYRPIAHDVTAPVMMHLEDKLAIYA
jgi:hypothetical protein